MEEFIVRCNALIAEQLEGISWTLLLLMMTAVFLLVHVAVLIWSRLRGKEDTADASGGICMLSISNNIL